MQGSRYPTDGNRIGGRLQLRRRQNLPPGAGKHARRNPVASGQARPVLNDSAVLPGSHVLEVLLEGLGGAGEGSRLAARKGHLTAQHLGGGVVGLLQRASDEVLHRDRLHLGNLLVGLSRLVPGNRPRHLDPGAAKLSDEGVRRQDCGRLAPIPRVIVDHSFVNPQ